MKKDLIIELNQKENVEFDELLTTSVWLSNPEKKLFSEENRQNQSRYLVNILYEALKEEKVFFEDLKENDKSSYKVFNEVKEWLEDENKSVEGFMSISDEDGSKVFNNYSYSEDIPTLQNNNAFNILDNNLPDIFKNNINYRVENNEKFEIDNTLELFREYTKRAKEKLNFDEKYFLELLEESLSLSVMGKYRVINAINILSQFQIDELTKNFENEKKQFTLLNKEHPKDIEILTKKAKKEWKELCYIFFKKDITTKIDNETFLHYINFIHEIEIKFNNFLFEEALESIENELTLNPNNFYLIEIYMQIKKALGDLNFEDIRNKIEINDNILYKAVELNYKLENFEKNQNILEEIENFEDDKVLKNHLLAKYYFYIHDEITDYSIVSDLSHDTLIKSDLNDNLSFAYLFNFYMKSLIYSYDYGKVNLWINLIFEKEIPLKFQYFDSISKLITGEPLRYIAGFSKINLNNFVNYFVENENSRFENRTFQDLKNDIENLIDISRRHLTSNIDDFDKKLKEIIVNFDNKEFEKIELLIESYLNLNLNRREFIELKKLEFELPNIKNNLDKNLKSYKEKYLNTPTFENSVLYLALLYEAGYSYREEVKELAFKLSKKYYFINEIHEYIFAIEHFRFTNSNFPISAKNSLKRLVSNGISKNMFDILAKAFRWEHNDIHGFLFSIINGLAFNKDFGIAMLLLNRYNFNNLAIKLFFKNQKENIYFNDNLNAFALGLSDKKDKDKYHTLISTLFYKKSIDFQIDFSDLANISNSSSVFKNLANNYKVINHFALYRSMLSINFNFKRTWNIYKVALDSSKNLEYDLIYLIFYFLGVKYNSPDIKEEDKEHIKDIIKRYKSNKSINNDITFYIYLIFAIKLFPSFTEKIFNIPNFELLVFDILQKIENLNIENIDKLFAKEAYLELKKILIEDTYLNIKYPKLNYNKKYEIKIEKLQELYNDTKDKNYLKELNNIIYEFERSKFIEALNSGRIRHSYLKTVNISKNEISKFIEEHIEIKSFIKSEIQKIKNSIDKLDESLILTFDFNSLEIENFKDEMLLFFETSSDIELFISKYYPKLLNIEFTYTYSKVLFEFYKSKNSLNKEIDLDYTKTSQKIFKTILKHHALEHSEMFESFRTKIRHGWLISSIKDSFARHELYSDKNEISPHLEDLLSNCKNKKFAKELREKLNIFKKEFDTLMSDLDKKYLWLKNESHPNGLLDFTTNKFDIEKIFISNNFLEVSIDNLIIALTKEIDLIAKNNFKIIKEFLQNRVFTPLNDKLIDMEKFLEIYKNYFNENELIYKWYDIFEKVESAKEEFEKRVEDYKIWFDFEESAIRDFNLSEIVNVAIETVEDLMQSQMRELTINSPKIEIDKSVKDIYLNGSNFSDILEIFKILLQNIIFHSKDKNEKNEIDSKIEIKRDNKTIKVKVTSTTTKEIDIKTLKENIFNETKRKVCLTGKEGSGLATIEEILLNRLDGVKGGIEDIKVENNNFIVEFKFEISKEGKKREIKEDSFYREIDTKEILTNTSRNKINILIVEDQESKFNRLSEFLNEFIINTNIVNIYDLESASKILADGFKEFDFMLLDMTLPLYPKANAPLKSLAGLTILKIMQVHNFKLPTILVTQYSNWFEEAKQNSRQFIESINEYCKKEFESFRGVVKFSHTDLSWQEELRELIENDSDFKYRHLQIMQKNIELKEAKIRQDQMMATLGQIAGGFSHALNNSLQTLNSFINLNKKILEKKGDSEYLKNFDTAQRQVKNMKQIIKHFRELAKGDKEKIETIEINKIINSAISLQKEQLKSYDIEINKNLNSETFIEANPLTLEQIFINLILNAKDSLNEVERDKKVINITTEHFLRQEKEYLRISICDNGKGIEEANLNKIFEPFYTTKGVEGMGLGLSQTKETLDKIEGKIRVFKQETGVCFKIELPTMRRSK